MCQVHGHMPIPANLRTLLYSIDKMLVLFAQTVRRSLRSDDIFARVGGDEFVVLMKHMPSETIAKRKGDSICRSLAEVKFDCPISCSIGLCVFSGAVDMKMAANRADDALYAAKKCGKGRCCLWKPESADAPDE